MNPFRIAISAYFQVPIRDMTFPRYFEYLNASGKITQRSLHECIAIIAVYLEDQEEKNEQYDQNFKDIAEVLAKLVDKKVSNSTEEKLDNEPKEQPELDKPVDLGEFEKTPINCPVCQKECASDFGLKSHMRIHNTDTTPTA